MLGAALNAAENQRIAAYVHAADLERCVPLVAEEVYPVGVIKRTNINLDVELVAAAAEQLGTRGNTDTVHAAMREVVARAQRRALAERDFTDLTPEALAELRAPRAG